MIGVLIFAIIVTPRFDILLTLQFSVQFALPSQTSTEENTKLVIQATIRVPRLQAPQGIDAIWGKLSIVYPSKPMSILLRNTCDDDVSVIVVRGHVTSNGPINPPAQVRGDHPIFALASSMEPTILSNFEAQALCREFSVGRGGISPVPWYEMRLLINCWKAIYLIHFGDRSNIHQLHIQWQG